ncbi:MAG: LEA type 2 family protein, partial [Dehalococcoidia bacterium]
MKGKAVLLALALGMALLLGTAGCERVEEVVKAAKPEIRGTTLEWGEVSSEAIEVTATMVVYNPSPISLPVKKITSDIFMNDIHMGSAETVGLSIEKNAEFPITVSARIDNTKIPAFWAEHLRRNEQSEALIKIGATFDLGITEFTFPFSLRRPITTDLLSPLSKLDPTLLEKTVRIPGTDREMT